MSRYGLMSRSVCAHPPMPIASPLGRGPHRSMQPRQWVQRRSRRTAARHLSHIQIQPPLTAPAARLHPIQAATIVSRMLASGSLAT